MKKKYKSENANFRQKAEKLFEKKTTQSEVYLSESDSLRLIHELQVHQIELELQNKELRLAKDQAEAASQKFAELYDSEPTGYFTLAPKGEILELNLTGAKMLGKERANIIRSQFQLYLTNISIPIFNLFLENVYAGKLKQTCELTFSTNTDRQIYIELSGIISENHDRCLATATDITERKKAEKTIVDLSRFASENPEPVVRIGRDGQVLYANAACSKFFTWKLEIGKLAPSVLQDFVADALNQRTGKVIELEHNMHIISVYIVPTFEFDYVNFYFHDITERKLAEESLLKLKKAVNNSGEIIFLTDQDGIFTFANPAFNAIYGYNTDEIIGKVTPRILKSGLMDANDYSQFWKNLKTGNEVRGEFINKRKDGTLINVEISTNPVFDERKKIIGFLGIQRDITERKRAEELLKESEQFLKETQQIASLGSYVLDIETGEWKSSEILDSIFGIEADYDKSVNGWTDIIHPEWRQVMREYLANEVIGSKKKFDKEYKIIRKNDKTERWVRGMGELVLNGENQPIKMVGTIKDITDRKQAEEILRESEATLDEALKMAKLGTWEYDVDSDQFKFNDQFYNLLHTTAEKEGGYNASSMHYAQKFVHPDDMSLVGTETQKALETTDPKYSTSLDHRVIFADGGIGYFSVNIRILKDSHGRTLKTYGVNQDITERKRTEESLRLFRTLLDKSNDAIEVIDVETGRFIDVNERACSDLGYSRNELLNMNVFDIDADQTPEVFRSIMDGFQHTNSTIIEASHKRKDGTTFPVEVNVTVVKLEKTYTIAIARDITERKRTTEALEIAKEYAENLIETANAIVIGLDAGGNITVLNKAAEEITGYTRSELMGQNWFETLVPKQFYPKVWEKFEKLSSSETPKKFENPILTKNGEERYVTWQNNQIIVKGNVVGTISFGVDITERRKSEEALRESRQILEEIINTIPVRVFWKDRNLVYLGCNMLFAHDAGYTDPAGIIGKDDFQMVWRDQAELYRSDDLYAIENNQSKLLIEEPQTTPDGKTITLLTSKIPLRGTNGEIIGILGTYIDITERKQSEEEILMLAHSLKSVNECVSITDLNDKILFVNESYLKTYGYQKEELIGKNITIVRSPNNPPELANEILPATKLGGWSGELLNRRKDGSEFPIHLSTTMINDKAGKPLGLIGVATDITEQKLFEKELIDAKERAEESDRLKSSFLANMSHEVRTPLNSIIGFSELLADPDFEEDQKTEFRGHIITNGNNLLNIISDIMDISKLESGEIKVYNRKINVHNFISNVEGQFALQAKEKNLELIHRYHLDSEETIISADPDRLRQIFNNLMSNAIKFTTNGKIEIEYRSNGKMVEFCIKDTGIGIPEGYQEKIFERFRQVDDNANRKFGGNGLGLAITKNLVELMGGKIWLISEPGVGSEFYFTLPAYLVQQ